MPAYGAISNDNLPTNTRNNSPPRPQDATRKDNFIGVLSHRSVVGQILSHHFWVLLIFFSIYADRINWLIQTVSEQLLFYLHDPALANETVTKFTLLLPLGGIIGVPVFGWLLDSRTVFDASLVIMLGGLVYGALGMMHSVVIQVVSISVFVVLRPLLYVFVGDYCGKAFGFQTFGRIYGLINTLVGLQGLVLGPVDRLVKGPLDGNYNVVNGVGLAAGLLSSALLSWSIRANSKPRQLAT
ncbi:hypothetical protein FRC09_009784 [Ceratobasidium sp. 395]|nr:hypothetical protein FRC09_009784 [Ceratobasidium sp. 395]